VSEANSVLPYIPIIQHSALGAEQVVLGDEFFVYHGVRDALADLLPDKGSVVLVGGPGEHDVIEIGQPFLEPRFGPQPLVLLRPGRVLRPSSGVRSYCSGPHRR
jgi:hypothetical protein